MLIVKKIFEIPEIDVIKFNMSESIANVDIDDVPSNPDWDIDFGDGDEWQ